MNTYNYDELNVGHTEQFSVVVDSAMIDAFSDITGDKNPLHIDPVYAASTRFKHPVVFGQLTASFLSTLAGMHLPGKYSLILSIDSRFKMPCHVGDRLTIIGEVHQKVDVGKILVLKTTIKNQHDDVVLSGTMHVQVLQ